LAGAPQAQISERSEGDVQRRRRLIMTGMMKPAPVKTLIAKDVLDRVDIRVGTIRQVDDVSTSKKLVRLRVDFGDHTRQILAGIRDERENRQELAGRQALFVVNLEPRRMAGEVSEGMLLDVGYEDGFVPVLAVPEKLVPDGARAG
jgi:tRNA-binding protein